MLLKKNIILKLYDNDISVWNKNHFGDTGNLNIDLKNKNVYLIIEGERVYIKLLNLPKVPYNKLYEMIKFELKYYFNNMEDILFDYSILREINKSYEVIVFCISSKKVDKLKNNISKNTNLKAVNLIQFVVFDYVNKYVQEDDYIFVFSYNENTYIIGVEQGNILDNSIIENFNGEIDKLLLEINHIFQIYENKNINIYFMWFKYDYIIDEIRKIYNCKIVNYDKINIIEDISNNRMCGNCKR